MAALYPPLPLPQDILQALHKGFLLPSTSRHWLPVANVARSEPAEARSKVPAAVLESAGLHSRTRMRLSARANGYS